MIIDVKQQREKKVQTSNNSNNLEDIKPMVIYEESNNLPNLIIFKK